MMFDINLLGSTFEKISRKEIQAFDMTGSRAPEVSKVFCFKALHVFTIIEAAKATCGLKSWVDRQNFPWRHGLGQANALMFFRGDFFAFGPRINYKLY
jgi:hypothetical protein